MATLSSIITPTNVLTASSTATLTNKTWNGNTIGVAYGGTGLSSLGTAGQTLIVNSGGTALEYGSVPRTPTSIQTFTFTALTGTWARAATKSGTYSRTSNTVTVTITSHGYSAGDRIYVDFTSGTANDSWVTIATVPTSNTFTFTLTGANTSGNATVYPPIVCTVSSTTGIGASGAVFLSSPFSSSTDTSTFYQITSTTFQVQRGTTEGANSSGTMALPFTSIAQTWTKPAGCTSVLVELVGGGSKSAGGYSRKIIDVTAISSVSVTVGYSSFFVDSGNVYFQAAAGSSSFGSHCSATGANDDVSGTGSNGNLNIKGSRGNLGITSDPTTPIYYQFYGNTPIGYGAITVDGVTVLEQATGYGSGGNSSPAATAIGKSGVVFVTEFY